MRRRVLPVYVVALVVLAGCVSPADVGETTATSTDEPTTTVPPTDEPTTTSATTGGMGEDGWYHGYEFTATRVSNQDIVDAVAPPATDLEPEREPLVRRGAADGSVTTTHTGEQGPLSRVDYVAVNGSFYAVSGTIVGSEPRNAFRFHLEGPVTNDSREYDADRVRETAVSSANLSTPDRRAFFEGLPHEEDRMEPGEGSFVAGYTVFYEDDTRPANATLADGDTHFVEHEGVYYAVTMDDRQQTTRYETRYEFEHVADSTEAFADRVRSEFVTPLSSLPDEDASLLRDVVENGTVEWHGDEADTPAHVEARARLVNSLGADHSRAYVDIDGTMYRITLIEIVE